jgi:hypothetical protein
MNTVPLCYSDFFDVASSLTGLRIRNDEVVGSSPTSSTNLSITYRHPLTQFCPKLVQKFSEWLPEFASTITGIRKTSCRVLQNPHHPRNKKGGHV